MKIIFIFSCSGMFRDVPECSGMFRNVPGCSMFLVLSTSVYSSGLNSGKSVYGKVFGHKKLYSFAFKGICSNPELTFFFSFLLLNS